MSTTGAVLGASTTAAGVAVLPNTSGNALFTVCAIVTIAAGVIVAASFVFSRVVSKFSR